MQYELENDFIDNDVVEDQTTNLEEIKTSSNFTAHAILKKGGIMIENKEQENRIENQTTNPTDGYKVSRFTQFLNIAYPVGITVLTSTSLGFGLYETMSQCKDLVDKPEALGFVTFSAALMSALILMALFHGYKNSILQEQHSR